MNESSKKPIVEILDSMKELNAEIKNIKNDISYIKQKIKEKVIHEKMMDEKMKDECVIESSSWWWN